MFVLPDDSTLTHSFPVAQTVAYLKVHLERVLEVSAGAVADAAAIPTPTLNDIELHFEEKDLPDPFSLVDVGFRAGQTVPLQVVYTDDFIQAVTAALEAVPEQAPAEPAPGDPAEDPAAELAADEGGYGYEDDDAEGAAEGEEPAPTASSGQGTE